MVDLDKPKVITKHWAERIQFACRITRAKIQIRS